jgi:hypothetical protein
VVVVRFARHIASGHQTNQTAEQNEHTQKRKRETGPDLQIEMRLFFMLS